MDITEQDYKKLKKLYDTAVKEDQETFLFKSQEIDRGYAKYLIEYLETRFKK
jgi:hypothetical protein